MGTNTRNICARERIAMNLKRLRNERRLSQESMAELAGFHRTYISQLERQITNISIDGLERIAQALEVDVLDLLKVELETTDVSGEKDI